MTLMSLRVLAIPSIFHVQSSWARIHQFCISCENQLIHVLTLSLSCLVGPIQCNRSRSEVGMQPKHMFYCVNTLCTMWSESVILWTILWLKETCKQFRVSIEKNRLHELNTRYFVVSNRVVIPRPAFMLS